MKKCQLMYFGPHVDGRFRHIEGVYQSAPNSPILNFLNNFSYKIQIERGSILWKNGRHKYLGPILQAVLKKKGLPISPKWTNLCNFLYKIQVERGSVKWKKNYNLCILDPVLWAVLDILGVCQLAQNSTILNFLTISYTKPKLKGLCNMKK